MKKYIQKTMNLVGLSKLNNYLNKLINKKILRDIEKLSENNDSEKIKIISDIIDPKEFTKLGIGLSRPDIVIFVYKANIEEQIKELKKITFYLKNKRKISGIFIASELKEITAYEYFITSENYFIDIESSVKALLELTKDFSEIIGKLERSEDSVDKDNFYSTRGYVSNIAINLESLAKVVMNT